MPKIEPTVLRRLRSAKNWSQEELAEKTRINKQTISRLERGDRDNTRPRTIAQLARALNVEPSVLTGEAPAPDIPHERSVPDPRSQLNLRVGAAPRNALTLAARRYRVEPAEIVELAPFLFVLAAEESLRQRRERIAEVERACEAARSVEREIPYLPLPNFTYSEEKIAAEYESIERRDLFGNYIIEETDFLNMYGHSFDVDTENPFVTFLRERAAAIGDVAEFEEWGSWSPQYRICPEEAAALVGGDRDRADEILAGQVALSEMPKELRQPRKESERAEWVREQAEEYRRESERALADLVVLFDKTEKAK